MKQRWCEITLVVPHLWDEILPHFLQEMGFSGLWIDEKGKPPYRLVLRTYLPEKAWEPYMHKQLEGHLKKAISEFPKSKNRRKFNQVLELAPVSVVQIYT